MHWQLSYPENLKRAYLITIGLTSSVLFLVFIFVKGKNLLGARGGTNGRVIIFTYAELGPPPSLTGEGMAPLVVQAAAVGIPKPVADTGAVVETTPTQAELGGTSPLAGEEARVEVEGGPAYVPYWKLDVKPEPKYIPMPQDSELARYGEGTVVVKALVDTDGRISAVEIQISSGSDSLDEAAARAARQALFTPAKQRGRNVRVWVSIPFHFVLTKRG